MNTKLNTFFSDHRNAITSVVVVLVVVIIGAIILDGFNGNTLKQRQYVVDTTRDDVDALMTRRFVLASDLLPALSGLRMNDSTLAFDIAQAVTTFQTSESEVAAISQAYNQLDEALRQLQRELVLHPELQESTDGQQVIKSLKALGECEDELVAAMAEYEEAVYQLRRRLNSFPMNISASRRDIVEPPRFSIQQALQTRP